MPRANRYHLAGHIWHLTHRCHRRQFLLRFARDRPHLARLAARSSAAIRALRARLCGHLQPHPPPGPRPRPRRDRAEHAAHRRGTAQAYNQRKRRRGAFWEDRYHATAVDSGEHLARCVVYIDLNMVRARRGQPSRRVGEGGYREIQAPLRRHLIIDRPALADALGIELAALVDTHAAWIEDAIAPHRLTRQPQCTESVAVGRREFVEQVGAELGARARYRTPAVVGALHVLREARPPYGLSFATENTPGRVSSP